MNPTKTNTPSGSQTSFINAANQSITVNGIPFANRVPNAQLVIYEDAGHGGIFQNYADFVGKALAFLDA